MGKGALGLAVQLLPCIVTEGHAGYFKIQIQTFPKNTYHRKFFSPLIHEVWTFPLSFLLSCSPTSLLLTFYLVILCASLRKRKGIFGIPSNNNNKEENGNSAL